MTLDPTDNDLEAAQREIATPLHQSLTWGTRRQNNWDSNRGSLNKRGPVAPILTFNIVLSKSVDALRVLTLGCRYNNKHTIYER